MNESYGMFILGYDLLREKLAEKPARGCDEAYALCNSVYNEFLKSGYGRDLGFSDYENLQRFVDDVGLGNKAGAGGLKLRVPYVAVWEHDVVESSAVVDCETGEVTQATVEENVPESLGECENRYIVLNDEIVQVYQNERGLKFWADLHYACGR